MNCSRCGVEISDGRDPCARCAEDATTLPGHAPRPTGVTPVTPATPATPPGTSLPEDATRMPGPRPVSSPTSPATAAHLLPGHEFGSRYRIIRELGRGGMGVVYQAWDDELSMAVALKVVIGDPAGDPKAEQDRQRRFKQELVLARQVTHKHVIRIHDLGEINGVKYFTMPFINGETLSALLRREGHVPVGRALEIGRQMVAGLVAAHEAGIVHRDLKPANIMLDDDGQVHILDFGIARSVTGPGTGTATGVITGTFDYMAPEQTLGSHVDQRADIYAFGLILSDLLVGRRAASPSGGALTVAIERTRKAPPLLRTVDPNLPEPVEQLVSRCLQPEPANRFQTTAELGAALDRLDDDGHLRVAAQPATARARWMMPAVAAACVVVLGLSAWLYVKSRPAPPAPAVHEPVSVLIANFDNKTGDPMFDGALEQPLAIAVEGASFITAGGHVDAEKLLAKLAPGSTLNEEGARIIARRDGTKVVLAGTVAQNASGYALSIRVVDPTADAPMASIEASAKTKEQVLASVGSLGARIRTTLGDTATASTMAAAAETFTASSLDAVKSYSKAQDLALRRKDADAIVFYKQAVAQDPKFGRAYAGWAASAANIRRNAEAGEAMNKALALMDRMTEREKYRTLGVYFFNSQDYEKAVENYETLVRMYPADTAGHANLALAYFYLRNFAKALEEGRRALKLQPGSTKFLSNNALYAMYSGDFDAAAADGEACVKLEPGQAAYLPIAIAQVAAGQSDAARQTYEKMAAVDAVGKSWAAQGLADVALYEGRPADARAILIPAIADDAAAKETGGLIAKHVSMAEAWMLEGRPADAWTSARTALGFGRDQSTLLPAARAALAAGKDADARGFADELLKQVPAVSRAYGKIIDGEIALKQRRSVDAVDAFKAARGYADLWLVHFDLGIAYVQAGLFGQAIVELETCDKRRGEATSLFFDDYPTYRHLAPLQYWLGRTKEGLGMKPAALIHYQAYIALRPAALKDPFAEDARKRVGAK